MSDDRRAVADQIAAIKPLDDLEHQCQQWALDWVATSPQIYRVQRPDVPKTHLVSYFAAVDEAAHEILLVDHRKAQLWVPTGGHIEPGEDPRQTVRRECVEELGVPAKMLFNQNPLFITASQTNGHGQHTDVSLWYVVSLPKTQQIKWDEREFAGVKWWRIPEILTTPADQFDPQLGRFARKLRHAWGDGF